MSNASNIIDFNVYPFAFDKIILCFQVAFDNFAQFRRIAGRF